MILIIHIFVNTISILKSSPALEPKFTGDKQNIYKLPNSWSHLKKLELPTFGLVKQNNAVETNKIQCFLMTLRLTPKLSLITID